MEDEDDRKEEVGANLSLTEGVQPVSVLYPHFPVVSYSALAALRHHICNTYKITKIKDANLLHTSYFLISAYQNIYIFKTFCFYLLYTMAYASQLHNKGK